MKGIDTADTVLHTPTCEEWVVAYVEGDRLAWVGWPEGTALLADCCLLKKAAPSERDQLLIAMAAGPDTDSRARYAKRRCVDELGKNPWGRG